MIICNMHMWYDFWVIATNTSQAMGFTTSRVNVDERLGSQLKLMGGLVFINPPQNESVAVIANSLDCCQ